MVKKKQAQLLKKKSQNKKMRIFANKVGLIKK